jgi:hypothetical protein
METQSASELGFHLTFRLDVMNFLFLNPVADYPEN